MRAKRAIELPIDPGSSLSQPRAPYWASTHLTHTRELRERGRANEGRGEARQWRRVRFQLCAAGYTILLWSVNSQKNSTVKKYVVALCL